MSTNKENVYSGKKGMNRDSHPSSLGKDSYTFMLNGNYEGTDGDFVQLQNEQSNLKCSGFKEGYKVVGHKVDIRNDRVFFFLSNPTTGCSEIGIIKNITCIDDAVAMEVECGCDVKVILETPLEEQEQVSLCNYETLVQDCEENKCLNFTTCNPFKEGSIQIKQEKCGETLYFTDGLNPPRYLQLDNLDIYSYVGNINDCSEDPEETCFDCNKLRIFPLYKKPCLEPETVRSGGNLTAGMYEFLVAYSDNLGNELSPYFSITQPIPIFDLNNNILDQTQLGYETNLGIRLKVEELDSTYSNYKVAVIYRNGLDGAVSYKIEGVHNISDNSIVYSSNNNKESITLRDLFAPKTTYLTSDGMVSGKGYLFQYGLKAKPELNLQPVVNLMGAFAKWATVRAKEDLYKDGVNVAKYTGYNRDEVYPHSIRFNLNGGYETAIFPLIPRPLIAGEDTVVTGITADSLDRCTSVCTEQGRTKKWQIFNTATVEGVCDNSGDGTETIQRTETRSCTVLEDGTANPEIIDSITGVINIPIEDPYTNIETYINTHIADIINPSSEFSQLNQTTLFTTLRDIVDDSDDDYPTKTCNPFEGEDCVIGTQEREILALGAELENLVPIEKTTAEYVKINAPNTCVRIKNDILGVPEVDQAFIDEYMLSSENVYNTVNVTNNTCVTANSTPIFIPGNAFTGPVYLQNQGALTLVGILDTSKTISSTSATFNSNLHKGARWYKVDFGVQDKLIIELSTLSACTLPEDNANSTEVRVSVFDTCSSSSDVVSTIVDLTVGGQLTIDRTAFTSGLVYVAIDAPFIQRNIPTTNNGTPHDVFTIKPPCECFNLGTRFVEFSKNEVTVTNLDFFKLISTTATCTVELPTYNGCEPTPYNFGNFSYWESEEKYPCNNELYDSSGLIINQSDIPVALQTTFEGYYTTGATTAPYTLNNDTDFKDKAIRHYKYPCNGVSPYMETTNRGNFQETFIYPIGFEISPEVINTFLDIAVNNNLITREDRDSITSYEIFRGDRRTQKSIVAKGLLFDMYAYSEDGRTNWYPNFPYNTLGKDIINDRNYNYNNVRYTFHSPETHLYRPTLGTEIKLEGYQFGKSEGSFQQVNTHPGWVILGQPAYNIATGLAIAEQVFETTVILGQLLITGAAGGYSAPIATPLAIITGAAIALQAVFKVGEIRYQWLRTFKDLGQVENFAYYYASKGHYNYFQPNTNSGEMVRGVCTTSYLNAGRWTVTDELTGDATRINNIDRERSVYLSLGDSAYNFNHPSNYLNFDNAVTNPGAASRTISSIDGCTNNPINKNVASPYVSIKNYIPDQYGKIDSIQWINTSFCGNLTTQSLGCNPVFGGDTFISRFSWKKKMPLFLTNAVGLADYTPFPYSKYRNIPTLQYYVDYEINDNNFNIGTLLFPDNRTDISNMDCKPTNQKFYIKEPAKFYLYYYGIIHFLVESDINCWVRYGKREQQERFFPQVGDYVDWTQEDNVSIKEPNTFFYNDVYSRGSSLSRLRPLPESYNKEEYDCLTDSPSGVIYSLPDNSESSLSDPWLVYRPFDKFEFPTSYGRLIDLSFIESSQLLGRFTDQVVIYNKLNPFADGTNANNIDLGNGALFRERPLEFNSTDLGYSGTQHRAKVSCEYGHFWVDAKRGQVFQMQPNGKGLNEITPGLRNWFKENLPFKIMKAGIAGLETEHLDNNYNSLGIAMGWDSRFRRVFITKKDYRVKAGCKSSIVYRDCKFYINNSAGVEVEISLQDSNYFEDCSFTIAYSPITKSWISYYSFKPDYYISYLDYFQTGLNNSEDNSELGLWSHLLTNNSFQVFYGKKHPWIIEIPSTEQLANSIMHNIEYWLDVRKYFNRHDFAERDNLGFNKAWVYNHCKNSGQLNLIKSEPNNLRQKMDYPKYNTNSIDILATPKYKKWSFNYLYDISKNQNSNIPMWINDCNQINKELNSKTISYRNTWKNKLQGDWFLTRLQQDQESRFKFIFKWSQDKKNLFNG